MPPADIVLVPDAGPLITLAYADSLDLLFKPGWPVVLVDMVLHEVTRHQTPASARLAQWAMTHNVTVLATRVGQRYQRILEAESMAPRKAHLGEMAIQDAMNDYALEQPPKTGVFLFEDHKIARTSFLVPEQCRKVSTRAFLIFLEQKGWLASAAAIECRAIQAGRTFSSLRFPS